MNFFCFLGVFFLSLLTVPPGAVLAEELSFSGQFVPGQSYSTKHYFTLQEDSAVEIRMNSSCNVTNFHVQPDVDDSIAFAYGFTQNSPDTSTWHGIYPLAGGGLRYRVFLSCGANKGEDYNITVRYDGANDHNKDKEPNNEKEEANIHHLQINGHLGYYYDGIGTKVYRDTTDYFKVEMPAGRYFIETRRLDETLTKSGSTAAENPYLAIIKAESPYSGIISMEI